MENIFETLAEITKPVTTYTFIITQDNEVRKEFNNCESDFTPFGWLLRNQGHSVSHALKYEGWKVQQINEQTKESDFWKH